VAVVAIPLLRERLFLRIALMVVTIAVTGFSIRVAIVTGTRPDGR